MSPVLKRIIWQFRWFGKVLYRLSPRLWRRWFLMHNAVAPYSIVSRKGENCFVGEKSERHTDVVGSPFRRRKTTFDMGRTASIEDTVYVDLELLRPPK